MTNINTPIPSYSSSNFQFAWEQWLKASTNESALHIELQRLHDLSRDEAELKDKVSRLKTTSEQLFDKIKSNPTKEIISRFRSHSTREANHASHLVTQDEFAKCHEELSSEQHRLEEASKLLNEQNTKVEDLQKSAATVDQCFSNLRLAAQSLSMTGESAIRYGELEEAIMKAESSMDSVSDQNNLTIVHVITVQLESRRIEFDMREVAKLVLRSEESFRQAVKLYESVSDIPLEWTLRADIGVKEYDAVSKLSLKAQTDTKASLKILERYIDIMPPDVKQHAEDLLGPNITKMSNLTGALTDPNANLWNFTLEFTNILFPLANSAQDKDIQKSQKLVLEHLEHLKSWAVETANVRSSEQDEMKTELRSLQTSMGVFLNQKWAETIAT